MKSRIQDGHQKMLKDTQWSSKDADGLRCSSTSNNKPPNSIINHSTVAWANKQAAVPLDFCTGLHDDSIHRQLPFCKKRRRLSLWPNPPQDMKGLQCCILAFRAGLRFRCVALLLKRRACFSARSASTSLARVNLDRPSGCPLLLCCYLACGRVYPVP